MNLLSYKLFFLTGFFVCLATAQGKTSLLQKAVEKYAKASSLQFDIRKTDEKVILGTKTESDGVLKFQKNKIYISQNGDKKIELFYSDKVLSLVEHPDADFDKNGKRKVTVVKKNMPPLIKSLVNLFSSPKDFNKEFLLVSEKKIGDFEIFELKSAQKNIKNLMLKIKIGNLELQELSFVDDVETKTTIQFSNFRLNAKMDKADFQFKALKSDEVMIE